ncbi:MAG: ABC transporter substrate-binding protein [Lysinibacillus sp.]
MKKMMFLLCMSLVAVLLAACGSDEAKKEAGAQGKELVIAEPVKSLGYLPLYIAIDEGFFGDLDVSVTTLSGGSAHTNAVLTDEAWAFVGGPEHNAFAKAKGAELRGIVNVVNKGNNYFTVAKGVEMPTGDLAEYFKGKKIATSFYGGTPNSITRYYLAQLGLDPEKDVELLEVDNSAIPSIIKKGEADIGVVSEPVMTQGIVEGIWSEPIVNIPAELGEYAYSTINVKQDTIESNPETVQQFVDGIQKALLFIKENPEASLKIAEKEFPTLDASLVKATIDRAIEDELWEYSGNITEKSVETSLSIVKNAGLLKQDISFEEIIDLQFLK